MAADEHAARFYDLGPGDLPYLAGTVLGYIRTPESIEPVVLTEQLSIDVDRERALSRYRTLHEVADRFSGTLSLVILDGYYVVGVVDRRVSPHEFEPSGDCIICGQAA